MNPIEKKIQKKVDEVNALIEKASNSDSDNSYEGNLMVVDTNNTWQEPAIYKPIVFRNGVLYIEYYEPYRHRTTKEKILKRNLEFDGYGTLLDIAKQYRSALRKEGIKYATGGGVDNDITYELENFNINNLDKFEIMQYNQFYPSLGKVGALQVLINNVEGDYSQLSEELSELAEKQMSTEEWNESTREMMFERDGYATGGGVGLIGNQKRIDMNHNGKIDAEDFKLLRSSMNGAYRKERKYVNHDEDYEVRYAKPRPKRTGYKGKRAFDDGGHLDENKNIYQKQNLVRERYELLNDMYTNEDSEVDYSDILKVGDIVFGDGIDGYARIEKEINDPEKGDYFIFQDRYDNKFAFFVVQSVRDLYSRELFLQNVGISEKDFLYSKDLIDVYKRLNFHKNRVKLYERNSNIAKEHHGIKYDSYINSNSEVEILENRLRKLLLDERRKFDNGGSLEDKLFLVKRENRVIADFKTKEEADNFIYEYELEHPRAELELIDPNFIPKFSKKYVPEKRLSEAEWMMKYNSSPEARAYSQGGTIQLGGKLHYYDDLYLDYVNNFISVQAFADHYGISKEKANKIIDLGRENNTPNVLSNMKLALLTELWFAVQQKDVSEYPKLKNQLDKYGIRFSIQNKVSEDAREHRRRKALSISEVHEKVTKIWNEYYKSGKSYAGGGKTTFKEKANAIAKKFAGKRVEPKYQKEYGKTYDKEEAKEVGNKIAGSQKAKYDAKAEKGAKVKKGSGNHRMKEVSNLAKKIRKDGEKWTDAIKRAYEQLK